MDAKRQTTGYWEISVQVGHAAVDAVADFLIRNGATGGVAIDETADQATVRAYVDETTRDRVWEPLDTFLSQLEDFGFELHVRPYAATRYVPTADWAHAWRDHYHIMHIGQRVVIRPVWRDYTPAPHEVVVDMDPGMAFGTGDHPTTMLCLSALDRHVIPGCTVADIGTGSGILAIAAAKLGSRHVDALDIDAEAVAVAQDNVRVNGVDDAVTLFHGDASVLASASCIPYDIIVMNIVADVIIASLAHVRALAGPHTAVLLSGIIDSRQNDVHEALLAAGWEVVSWTAQGEWRLVHARLKAPSAV